MVAGPGAGWSTRAGPNLTLSGTARSVLTRPVAAATRVGSLDSTDTACLVADMPSAETYPTLAEVERSRPTMAARAWVE